MCAMSEDPDRLAGLAAEVLGRLYSLAAAHLNGDQEAMSIILEDVSGEQAKVMPEAAIAIAYTSVNMLRCGDDPFSDPAVAALPRAMIGALEDVLDGSAPDFVRLHEGDSVDAAVRTVGAIWLWAAYGEREEALRIARRHCVNMFLHRNREGDSRGSSDDDEGWN